MQRAAQGILFVVLLSSASLCLAQNNASNLEQGTASISGRITIDGKPARAITVQAVFWKDSPVGLQQTKSDSEGRYAFNHLIPGRYVFELIAPGMIGFRKANDNIRRQVVITKADEAITDVDFTLIRGGVVTGRVTYADGSPVIGIKVVCSRQNLQEEDGSEEKIAFTSVNELNEAVGFSTDDRGVYRVYGLAPGHYKVYAHFNNDEIIPSRRYKQIFFYPNTTNHEKTILVKVTAGNVSPDIDIRLSPPEKLYTAAGRVVDADTSKPLVNLPVICTRANTEGRDRYEATTDRNGNFKFEYLPSAAYEIILAANHGTDSEVYSAQIKFDINNENVEGLELKVYRGLSIRGTITVAGELTVEKSDQIKKLSFSASSYQASPDGKYYSTSRSAEIDANNNFLIKGLSPGKVRFSVFNTDSLQLVSVEHNNIDVTNNLDLQPGETINNLLVTLAERDCAIRGKIIIENGTLPKNASLSVYTRWIIGDTPDPYDYRFRRFGSIEADRSFTIKDLIAGKYEVTLIAEIRSKDKIDRWIAKQRVSVDSRQTAETTVTLDLIADKEK
jgi:hypothetical protein